MRAPALEANDVDGAIAVKRSPRIDVYGFGFAGWAGHPWEAERHWFETGQEAGRLRPPTRP